MTEYSAYFVIDEYIIFKLGSCTTRSVRGVVTELTPDAVAGGGEETRDAALHKEGHAMVLVGDSVNHFIKLKDELLKIQNVVLGLHTRLAALEGGGGR